MEISGSSPSSAQSAVTAKSASVNSASAANASTSQTSTTASPQPAESSTVTLSGEALMASRLYGSDQGIPTAPQTELNKSNADMSYLDWLTDQDRSTLADMYSYAQQQGADLRYVEMVAFDLGMYRKYGSVEGNANSGGTFDSEGHALTVSFGDKDAATAESILNGDGIKSTTIDTGFLNYELNPGYSGNHFANFQFVEQMVNHFSNVGSTQPLAPQFSTFTYKNESVVNMAKDVTFKQEEPDMVSVNGVWSITETGTKNGYSLVNGVPVQKDAQAKAGTRPLDAIKPPQSWMAMLLSLLQNPSAKKDV